MAIESGAFLTIAQARAAIGLREGEAVDDDGVIEALVNRATGLFEQYTGRKLYRRVYIRQQVDGTGESTAFLPEYPVVAVTSLKTSATREFSLEDELAVFDGTGTQTADDFEVVVDYESGQIELADGSTWPEGKATILASYEAGLTALTAPELVQAQGTQVAQWYFARGRDPKIKAHSIGGLVSQLDDYALCEEVRAILDAHRRVAPVA